MYIQCFMGAPQVLHVTGQNGTNKPDFQVSESGVFVALYWRSPK